MGVAPAIAFGPDGGGGGGMSCVLLPECFRPLLELLDATALARLRRAARLGPEVAWEAKLAEARLVVLELLAKTKFPFSHAAYVLGMNGPYYSLDTAAERHYGIPRGLPERLCALFRLEAPGAPFTTLRFHKFSAAGNFGGRHRTLAFSLSSPDEARAARPDITEADVPGPWVVASQPSRALGHALCLAASPACLGGFGEVCDAGALIDGELRAAPGTGEAPWRRLTEPEEAAHARWVQFPAGAWLRWHWPCRGEYYAITATCECEANCARLRPRERRQLAAGGFVLPTRAGAEAAVEAEDEEESEEDPDLQPEVAAGGGRPSGRLGASGVRVAHARRILGLEQLMAPTAQEVEEAFRRLAREAHPDRAAAAATAAPRAAAGAADPPGGEAVAQTARDPDASWRMAQLTWARRVLRDAGAEPGGAAGGAPAEERPDEQPAELLQLTI